MVSVITSKLAEVSQAANQNAQGNQGNNGQVAAHVPPLGRRAHSIAKGLFGTGGAAALVSVVSLNPVISTAIKGALAKVGGFITSNLAAFATTTMGVGVLNVMDGVRSTYRGWIKRDTLDALNKTLSQTDQNSPEYARLKKLYRTTQIRGALQVAVGIVAVTVGALALAGVVSNPFGLAAVVIAGAATLIGVQIHKYLHNRKIARAETQYNGAYDRMVTAARNARAAAPAAPVAPAAAPGSDAELLEALRRVGVQVPASIEIQPSAGSSNGVASVHSARA